LDKEEPPVGINKRNILIKMYDTYYEENKENCNEKLHKPNIEVTLVINIILITAFIAALPVLFLYKLIKMMKINYPVNNKIVALIRK